MIVNLRDGINMVSRFTPRRAANAASLLSSYYRSRITGRPRITAMPLAISVEPTTSCNLRCPECPSGLRSFTRATGMLETALFNRIIDEVSPTLGYLTFYFQGEPYLHPQLLEMVRYTADRRIYTATSTNGHFLKADQARDTIASGLDRLIISIDGTTQETYSAYRVGGSLEKVTDAAANILAWKKKLRSKTPEVVFQFLVVGPNEHQIPDVYRLAKKIGVDKVVLKTAQIYDYQHGSPLIPRQQRYSRYIRKPDGTYTLKNSLSDHCWKMWQGCVVTWDGKIVPCCFDKDAHFVLGDLSKNSFRDIWFGDRYTQFRQSLLRSRAEIEICKNCTEGTQVWG